MRFHNGFYTQGSTFSYTQLFILQQITYIYRMNQNIIIGIIVALIVVVGGYVLITSNSVSTTAPTTEATSTTPATENPSSNPTSAVTNASAPSVVTNTNSAPTNSTAVVTGSVTPNGAPTAYWYEYGQSTALGNTTPQQTIGSGFSAIASPGYITGLSTNTTYYFRLSAQNSFGTIHGATYSFATNNNPPGQGSPPSANTDAATSLTSTSAVLNAHLNAHSSPTTFWFEYGVTNSFGNVSGFQQGGSSNTSIAVSAAISGLNPLTTYYFRVNEQNQYGTVNGGTQTFTTTGPAASKAPVVTTQVASPVNTQSATLRGTVNPSGTQTSSWFEYSTDSLLGSVLLSSTSHKSVGAGSTTVSLQVNISGLKSKTTYYYHTVAQSSAGIVRGNTLSFKTN
jgi:phosphodiesterase/alkaline phosphatase D-like protein